MDKIHFLPRPLKLENRKTVIFDLDETLVHCVEGSTGDAEVMIKFPTGEYLVVRIIQVGINVRPFAKECLIEANKVFEVMVFTASHKCYADAVIDYLDPTKELIHHRLYRDNCVMVKGMHLKDLRIFANRDVANIVIIDNAVHSFAYHLDNGIPMINTTENF